MKSAAVALTIDVHEGDHPDDIAFACDWLLDRSLSATFFVPSSLFGAERYRRALARVAACGHEPASHSHLHDAAEQRALMNGGRHDLAFLADSKRRHEDFFGSTPVAFRSPCWCRLGPAAFDTLEALGYRVDASATPQRLSLLSSNPFSDTWTFAPRPCWYVRPSLLEVPTSSLLVPAGSPTFLTFRRRAARLFVGLLLAEARLLPGRVLNLQFHCEDFHAGSPRSLRPAPFQWRDLLVQREGGFGFKRLVREWRPHRIAEITHAILDGLRRHAFLTLTEIERIARSLPHGDPAGRRVLASLAPAAHAPGRAVAA